jgi:hypothetical protein
MLAFTRRDLLKLGGEAKVVLRLMQRRCGPINPSQEAMIRALPLEKLEALASANQLAGINLVTEGFWAENAGPD